MRPSTIVNIPIHLRDRFKAKFPTASFYGRSSLGSKRYSYYLPNEEYEQHKDVIKQMGGTKAKNQPFLKG